MTNTSLMTNADSPQGPGWYQMEDGPSRFFDGTTWTARVKKPESPYRVIAIGLVVEVLGGALVAGGVTEDAPVVALVGVLVATLGLVAMLIGTISLGVVLGTRQVDFERQQRTEDVE